MLYLQDRNVQDMRSVHFYIAFVFVLIVSVVSFSVVPARANSFVLYASTCLGGWENTNRAAGSPQTHENGFAQPTQENSARVDTHIHAQIYCGGFSGDILDDTVPKKILVHFSWVVEYPTPGYVDVPMQDVPSGEAEEASHEGASDAETISPEESLSIPIEVPLEGYTENSGNGAETYQENTTVEPSVDNTDDTVFSQESISEPAPEVPTAPVDDSVSFLRWVVAIAHAQEIASDDLVEQVIESQTEDTPQIIQPIEAAEPENQTVVVEETDTEDSSTHDIMPVSTAEDPPVPYGLVEVLYTLDGVQWKSLGFVAEDAFNTSSFEIPIEEVSDWEDISNIQVAVQSVPVVDVVAPSIYLDALWIEAEYDFLSDQNSTEEIQEVFNTEDQEVYALSEDVIPEELEVVIEEAQEEDIQEYSDEPALGPGAVESHSDPLFVDDADTIEDIFSRRTVSNIEADPSAQHYCNPEHFSVTLRGKDAISEQIFLTHTSIPQEGMLYIGSLPKGIDVRFVDTDDYTTNVSAQTKSVPIGITRMRKAQSGSFSVLFAYTLAKDTRTAVCQLNIINE